MTNAKLDGTVRSAKNVTSDGSFIQNGKQDGGPTIRVHYGRMSPEEKKAFESHVGFKVE